jgi:hypothetical protein
MKRADAEQHWGRKTQHPWRGKARTSHVNLSPTDWKARPGWQTKNSKPWTNHSTLFGRAIDLVVRNGLAEVSP